MITLNDIRSRLSIELRNCPLSQSEIARRLGISQTQISCYIYGKKLPALDTFANLCVLLDVDPADILGTNNG